MGDTGDGTGESGPDDFPLPHIDAWSQIDTMRRCFPYSRAEQNLVSVTPLDQLAAKREASQEPVKASACPARDPGSLDTLRADAEFITTPLVEELALRIQARLLARLRPLLDAELEAWMSEAIRDEVRKLAGGESVQGEFYSNRHLTKHSLRKTRFVPPIEP